MEKKVQDGKNLKISLKEIGDFTDTDEYVIPKYTSSIINQVSQWAHATRPNIVGQLSELSQECPYKNFEDWKKWYLERYPDTIDTATSMILGTWEKKVLPTLLKNFKEEVIHKWVEDLVLKKTFIGFKFQIAIIKKVAKIKGESYKTANSSEESKGIDGFIGTIPVQIKPITYKESVQTKNEQREIKIIWYQEKKKGDKNVFFDASDILL